jgi:dynein heavy chain
LLTGSIQGTRNSIIRFLEDFSRYDWLWKERIDERLRKFNAKQPQLEDFEAELSRFTTIEEEIKSIDANKQIGALSLKTDSVKSGLTRWITQWKQSFAKDLHKKASTMIESLQDDMKHIKLKIEKPAQDIDSLGSVMQALEEIRTKESEIEIEFRPVIDMYRLLEVYIPEVMEKEEVSPQ